MTKGAADIICTQTTEPLGDVNLLTESVKAVNAKSDLTKEERKGIFLDVY
jgi:hypothetical protein